MSAKLLIALRIPATLLEKIDTLANGENRNRTGMILHLLLTHPLLIPSNKQLTK